MNYVRATDGNTPEHAMHVMSRNVLAMLWKLIDSLLLSIMLLVGAKLTSVLSSFQIVFIVNLLAAVIASVIFSVARASSIRPQRPKLHFYRGLLGVISTACFLLSLQRLGLAESTAIGFLAPIITAVVSTYRLRETMDSITALALALNFLSILLILSGGFERSITVDGIASVGLSITSMLCAVMYNLNLKRIGTEDTVAAQSVFGPLFSALIIAPLIVLEIDSMMANLDIRHALLAVLYATLLIIKSSARYFSFKLGDLSKMMPMEYSQMIFTSFLAAIFLNEKITPITAVGMGIMIITAALQICREVGSPMHRG